MKLFDGGGLHLLVKPSGARLWRLKYRIGGKEKLLAIGAYPAVSLKTARTERDRAKELLASGNDPGEAKRIAAQAAKVQASNTFAAVATALIDKMKRERRAKATIDKASWLLAMANDAFGRRPVAEIKASEVLAVLKRVESAGKLETARRLRSTISRVFRLAVAAGLAETDPTFALRGAVARPTTQPRAAITELAGLHKLRNAVESYDGQPSTRTALLLLALLASRPGELRHARWDEFDLNEGIWYVPAERMKMRRPHRVPLAPQAVAIIKEHRELGCALGLVFPSLRGGGRPMSENTMNAALRTLGYSSSEMTSHGFRAAFSTIANESGLWHPDAIERSLAHVDSNSVRRAYARGEYWDERVRLMVWWAKLLLERTDCDQ